MKKFIVLLIVVVLIVLNNNSNIPNTSAKTITPTQETQLRDLEKQQVREKELEKLQTPEYVLGEIRKVGKLTTLESQYKYSSNIKNEALFGHLTLREITLDFTYNFAIGMDLQYIKIKNISDKTIVIQIPKSYLQLEYIEMDQSSRIIDGKKMFLVSQFKPSEVEILIKQSQSNVANEIGANRKLFDQALVNLQDELSKLINSMGFQNVEFEVI